MYRQILSGCRLLLLSATLAGCSSSEEPLTEQHQHVLGGQETGFDHAGVFYVTSEQRMLGGTTLYKIGSGSLIAPNLVMTALHVISTYPSNVPFKCDASGTEVSGSNGSLLGPAVAAEKVAVFAGPRPGEEPLARGVAIISSNSPTICKNDIAFVVLDTSFDLPYYPVNRGAPVEAGAAVTVVGFGTDAEMDVAVRTQRDVDVTAVGQWIRTFTVSPGPCEGDSGGPALAADGSIVGVFSSVATDCLNDNAAPKYTDVSYFGSLLDEAYEAAGFTPDAGQGGQGGAVGQAGEPAAVAGTSAEGGTGGDVSTGGTDGSGEEPREASRDDSGCSVARVNAQGSASAWLLLLGVSLMWRRVVVGARRSRACAYMR